jgi:signal transduction histidine kinase
MAMVTDITERKKNKEKLEQLNKELAFQNDEKENRAAELIIANKELAFQNDEKENRAAELIIANKELAFQNDEKENRAAELIIANKELAFQNDEKENRAAELNTTNTELLKTNRELDRFVYSVSHDLRSPLTSILGLVSFIEEESQEDDTLEHIGMIRNSVNRLDEFIKNILSYSRNNRTGLEIVQIPLQKTATEIVNSLRSMKEAKEILFEIDIKEEYPFYSDRLRLNTLLENLVSNAIKYHKTAQTDSFIKIIGKSDQENLSLSIIDNGIGIASEHHKKIFDMFFRLSGKKNGSGIGLYIVKDTIQILRGSIQVHSEEGIGTTFNITLKNLKP